MRIRVGIVFLSSLLLAVSSGVAQLPNEQSAIFVGAWEPVFNWPVVAIHASVLPDGRVLTWQRNDPVLTTQTWIWNPATGGFTSQMNNRASIFCSGHTFLKDGRLFVAGGHVHQDHYGSNALTFLSGSTWSTGPDMGPASTSGRWYPSVTMLRNGDVAVLGGENQGSGDHNRIPQVWQAATNTWRNLTARTVPLYPMTFLAPDGRVFVAGPNQQSLFLCILCAAQPQQT